MFTTVVLIPIYILIIEAFVLLTGHGLSIYNIINRKSIEKK